MSDISRRNILTVAAGAAAFGGAVLPAKPASSAAARPLRVQYTTGQHTIPITQYEMFDDPMFRNFNTWVQPFPNAFDNINDPDGPDVLVLGTYITGGYPEKDRPLIERYLDSGKGLVVLHHAVGDNQTWPWWYQEVTGGGLIQRHVEGMPRAGLKQFPKQRITPVMDHPITRGVRPFILPPDELFYNMWFSPRIQVLMRSDDPDLRNVNGTNAWLGLHPKARVVCWQSGHTDQVNADPRYRRVVHNMISWAGGRLV